MDKTNLRDKHNRTEKQGSSSFRAILLLLFFSVFSGLPAIAAEAENIWSEIQSGEHVVLLRHALAPGTGDPAGFKLQDCSTQRNLSATGREQARQIGTLFRANGIKNIDVFSSQWCRCQETARLLGLGSVEELPALNSFFGAFHKEEQQTRELRQWLAKQDLSHPLVLVTHQVNITALTGVYPRSGELVVLRRGNDGRLTLVGRLRTD